MERTKKTSGISKFLKCQISMLSKSFSTKKSSDNSENMMQFTRTTTTRMGSLRAGIWFQEKLTIYGTYPWKVQIRHCWSHWTLNCLIFSYSVCSRGSEHSCLHPSGRQAPGHHHQDGPPCCSGGLRGGRRLGLGPGLHLLRLVLGPVLVGLAPRLRRVSAWHRLLFMQATVVILGSTALSHPRCESKGASRGDNWQRR